MYAVRLIHPPTLRKCRKVNLLASYSLSCVNADRLKLNTDKPIAFFDIEATGINFRTDRMIELAIVVVQPDGARATHHFLFNPERPIPAESTAIHGISDDDVKDCPVFREVAPHIRDLLEGCDLGGYNVIHYDIPLLEMEFERVGIKFDPESRRIIDAQKIFHKREPRDLTAALKFYCGDFHADAHGALGDVEATIRVLEGQFDKYPDLPREVEPLSAFCDQRDPSWADRKGRFKWVNGELIINFGKKQGQSLKDISRQEPSFLRWMLSNSFPPDVTAIARNALDGKFPPPPPAAARE